MRKILLLIGLFCFLLSDSTVWAEESAHTSSPIWETSVLPKPSAEEIERARWTYLFANDIGIYAFDHTSLHADETDKNVVHVLVKTVFCDPKLVDKLAGFYKEKLSAGDKVAYSEMQMVFQLRGRKYAVTETKVVSEQKIVLEDTEKPAKFLPVPSNTFAESMYDVAKNYARNN